MAPIRRYLRITKYSVLETRIYLDNPSLITWLLSPRLTGATQEPILQRIITAIRPLVLPKLREEYEAQRNKSKGKKKKNVKDIVVEDDFEVAIFLTNDGARHSLCVKGKVFKDKKPIESNSNKLMTSAGDSAAQAISVEGNATEVVIRQEDSDEEPVLLGNIPDATEVDNGDDPDTMQRQKRRRSGSDELFVDDDEADADMSSKRIRIEDESDEGPTAGGGAGGGDDKKKMAMNTIYDGFSIHGKALCLVVKRKDHRVKTKTVGQEMMENWMTSTQIAVEDTT